ncbi:hypothetical protein JOD29_000788 [Lysinibacillus composti]|uniref:hypothetical protein n=1 Tax=Lysinibacillus composti TaxID=720633 RepID=UPI0013156142|nr:hypothetical protein [Lysinibacillus composti]MBM7607544.1 hypothetical protein [Lysinibacillus composti]
MKSWLDRTFLLTEDEINDGYEVDGSDYWWFIFCILGGLFGLFIALQWWITFA